MNDLFATVCNKNSRFALSNVFGLYKNQTSRKNYEVVIIIYGFHY